jgi:hypothetical protein
MGVCVTTVEGSPRSCRFSLIKAVPASASHSDPVLPLGWMQLESYVHLQINQFNRCVSTCLSLTAPSAADPSATAVNLGLLEVPLIPVRAA